MLYRAIGLMSGSSLDGLDIAYVHLNENGGKWSHEIIAANCYGYDKSWKERLRSAPNLNAYEYLLLHTEYGLFLGNQTNRFIDEHGLHYKVQLIASHGHTSFHHPEKKMTAQLGDAAAIAAVTGLNVIADLRAMDIALGGQGAPVVPIGEKLLFPDYSFFLNIGGIANLSYKQDENFVAFDICPANSILDQLSAELGKDYDQGGEIAAKGKLDQALLNQLNEQIYYSQPFPKSLSNNFGREIIYPIIKMARSGIEDKLHTYTAHITEQICQSVRSVLKGKENREERKKLLATGGGSFNHFLIAQLKNELNKMGIDLAVPEENLVKYKEALIMALMGVLRWREENNVMCSVTGASRSSIGGAIWIGMNA